MIRWSATLATTNGLVTPTLERVDLVYEYLGLPARVELRWPGWPSPIVVPSGGVERFTAVALDAGSHVISKEPNRFDWNTNDSHGQVGIDGSYRAGEAGDHIVNVTFVGTTLSANVWLTGTPEPSGWMATVTDNSLSSGNCGLRIQLQSGISATITSFKALSK